MKGAWSALGDGLRRVTRAPALLAGMCTITLLIALPLSIALRGMLQAHLGQSIKADVVADGADYEWWREFQGQATGLGTTFGLAIGGFGAVLANISGLLDNEPLAATIAGATAAWLIIWSFLTGGVIDRLARDRPTRASGFFAACGLHVWRVLRLGIGALVVYWLLFSLIHAAIFRVMAALLTTGITSDRTAFLMRLGAYAVFGTLLALVSVIFDYARIRLVVEDRRSAVAAVAAAARFVRGHFGTVGALYVLNSGLFLILALVYALLAPSIPRGGAAMWIALLVGQAYIIGRHYLKLAFYASQCTLFQSALAHASYTAGPSVLWPESPAVEAIINATGENTPQGKHRGTRAPGHRGNTEEHWAPGHSGNTEEHWAPGHRGNTEEHGHRATGETQRNTGHRATGETQRNTGHRATGETQGTLGTGPQRKHRGTLGTGPQGKHRGTLGTEPQRNTERTSG